MQLPGPTNVPDRVLSAMHRPIIDHRGPEFGDLMLRLFEELKWVFGGAEHVFIFPSSATGCWEAALVNTLSPGARVLLVDNGFFASKWGGIARSMGYKVDVIEADWRHPVDPAEVERRLQAEPDTAAVLMVHNETSTGVTSDVAAVRRAIDAAGGSALLMVDAVSSLGATAFEQAEWGVDVTVCGSQKGLMLPPGLGFCAVSQKALDLAETGGSPRGYWDWADMLAFNDRGFFPYTPPTSLLYGLEAAFQMLREEGLENVFARHARLAEATRHAVAGWGLENYCADAGAVSSSGTTVRMPDGHDAEAFRINVLERFDMSLGTGLGPLKGEVFRIGHLGDFNELMLMGTLAGVEMGLRVSEVPHGTDGLSAATAFLAGS